MVFCNIERQKDNLYFVKNSHNPYFNRWFSAIQYIKGDIMAIKQSQSLF